MLAAQRSVPKWLLLVSGFLALIEIMVSISLVVSPKEVVEQVDLNESGVLFLIYMWAVRQFALGVILAYSTLKRSPSMLTISYIFLLVMFIGDMLVGVWQKETSLIIAAGVMCIISCGILYAIRSFNRKP